jgi:Family of unknown function (DUF6131)
VILFGVVLMIIGLLLSVPVLWSLGVIVLIIGLVLWLLGTLGHAVGGRRHYY